jgi:AcrR family transcriptional regulator
MATYAKLHPGPGLSREDVASHQRARLRSAMAEMVTERDYEAVTIAELVRRARISPRDFYRHYDSKEACFLATYERAVESVAQSVEQARRDAPDWRTGVEHALLAFTGAIAAQPDIARLALIEAFAAGPAALQRMRGTLSLFAALLEENSLANAPDPVELPSPVARGIASGVTCIARARLMAGREQELPGLVPALVDWALCFRCPEAAALCVGPGSAARACGPRNGAFTLLAVADHEERGRILQACARLVTSEGYASLTAQRIRAAAGVTRSCFDAHFEDHRDCLLATVETASNHLLMRAAAVGRQAKTWPAGVHRAMVALCLQLAHEPALATLTLVEVFSPGPRGARCRERLVGNISGFLRRTAPPSTRPSKLAVEASVGAVSGALHEHTAMGTLHTARQLAPVLSFFVLAPAIGAEAAIEMILDKGRSAAEHLPPVPPHRSNGAPVPTSCAKHVAREACASPPATIHV